MVNAIATSTIGILHDSLILHKRILNRVWQAGSVLFPFITGAILKKKGIQSLRPL